MNEKKSVKNITIICSGEDFDKNKLADSCKKSDFIISVDGGLNILDKLKIVPSVILGDLDSVEKKLIDKYKEIKLEKYPSEKDLTDSELAIKKAISMKPDSISIFAGTGSYIDHSFANLINLFKYSKKDIEMEIITSNSKIFPIRSMKKISNSKGRRFSLFPIIEIKGLEIIGAKYQFRNNSKLNFFDYSISNVINEKELIVKFKKGMMFCVLFDEGYK